MIKHLVSSIAIASALVLTANAGTPDKTITQPMTSVDYGTGPYVAVQGGFNAGQDKLHFADGFVTGKSGLGGFGGVKAGYGFGTGIVSPAVEFDGFYNRFGQDTYASGFGKTAKVDYDSGAFLVNALARVNLGVFQPYVGAGIGGYTAEGFEKAVDGFRADSGERASWAWQIVAGADYYVTHSMSVFAEYKFLNYMDASYLTGDNRFGQQLAGAGVRFHF